MTKYARNGRSAAQAGTASDDSLRSGPALDRTSKERQRLLGQNFFRSVHSARRCVSRFAPSKHATVIEIGAGSGMLTRALAQNGRPVVAVEVDPYWAHRLVEEQLPGVTVVAADFLRWTPPSGPLAVIGNLPFGSSTDMLRRCLELGPGQLEKGAFLLQHQYVEKRTGRWGNNLFNTEWGPWYRFRAGLVFPRQEFRPIPNADTKTLLVEPHDPSLLAWAERNEYQDLARAVFTTGHLTLGAALRAIEARGSSAWLRRSGLDRDRRVKDLTIADWLALLRSRPSPTSEERHGRPRGERGPSRPRAGPTR